MSYINFGKVTEALNTKVDKAHEVIAFQAPTIENNYTWYRLYADGWVEQGGLYVLTATAYETINLLVEMANTNYFVSAVYNDIPAGDSSVRGLNTGGYTTTSFKAKVGVSGTNYNIMWEVKGMAATGVEK